MSWNAQRFKPGKPVLRAVRHRKKLLSKAESAALQHEPPTENEIDTALIYATDHKLDRLAAIIQLANQITVYARYNAHAGSRIEAMRQSRQRARTRMRAGKHVTRFAYPHTRRR